MAKPANVRAKCRKHYVFDRFSLEQAAKLAEVVSVFQIPEGLGEANNSPKPAQAATHSSTKSVTHALPAAKAHPRPAAKPKATPKPAPKPSKSDDWEEF